MTRRCRTQDEGTLVSSTDRKGRQNWMVKGFVFHAVLESPSGQLADCRRSDGWHDQATYSFRLAAGWAEQPEGRRGTLARWGWMAPRTLFWRENRSRWQWWTDKLVTGHIPEEAAGRSRTPREAQSQSHPRG